MSGGRRCAGCGGVLGRDCWNEADCVWITQDMAARAYATTQQPEPCQGCSEVTDQMRECIGVCVGLTSQEDLDARRAAWLQMLATPTDPTRRTP